MRRRRLTFLLAGFFAVWFGVVIPAHDRGAVSLPDGKNDGACPSCCTVARKKSSHPGDRVPPADPVPHCALCQFVATLDQAPPPVLGVPELLFLVQLDVIRPVEPVTALTVAIVQPRAPPA